MYVYVPAGGGHLEEGSVLLCYGLSARGEKEMSRSMKGFTARLEKMNAKLRSSPEP